MQVFVFRAGDRSVLGYTFDKRAANLPPRHAPWALAGELASHWVIGAQGNPVTEAIRRDGYDLAPLRGIIAKHSQQ